MAWQNAYVAMTMLFEGTPDLALGSLSEGDRAFAAQLGSALANPDRTVRAKALAAELAKVAHALEDAELGA